MKKLSTEKLDLIKSTLSEEELGLALEILEEINESGSSELLDELWSEDYEELPVDIKTFITDPDYLGQAFMAKDGSCLIYDYWLETLEKVFSPDSSTIELALSGAIGLGKSTIADIGLAYILHKLLCLKDPAAYYRLTKGSRIAIALFNITLDQGYGVGYTKLQNMLKQSPWFLRHGSIVGNKYPTYVPGKDIDIIVGSKSEHFIGRDVFAAFMDELNFANGSDVSLEKSSIMKLYNTIKRRMESRYMKSGRIPGMLFLVSSKKSTSDFLEAYIQENKNRPNIYLVDEPLWVVKSSVNSYSGKTFKVAVGNTYVKSKILSEDEDYKSYEANGQEVIDVPIEHLEAFEQDINSALMDIAGKSLANNLKYIYYDKLKLCYRDYLHNPFTMDEISLGFDDDSEMRDFFIPERLSKLDISKPHFIHWDASKSGDATGLAMSTISGRTEVRRLLNGEMFDSEDIVHKLEFALRILAKPGSEIPFYKIRNFIYHLKFELGYNILLVTCDSYQSVDTIQQMNLNGLTAKTQSVDRTMAPYTTVKNAINEGRLIMPYIPTLEYELLNVEEDKSRGKVDHPVDGRKDVADAMVGSIFGALSERELLTGQKKTNDAELAVAVNSRRGQDAGGNDWFMGGRKVYD